MFIEGAFQTENRASTLILHRDVQTKFVDPTTIEFPLCGRYSPKCSLAAPNAVFWNPSGINAEESGVDYLGRRTPFGGIGEYQSSLHQ